MQYRCNLPIHLSYFMRVQISKVLHGSATRVYPAAVRALVLGGYQLPGLVCGLTLAEILLGWERPAQRRKGAPQLRVCNV